MDIDSEVQNKNIIISPKIDICPNVSQNESSIKTYSRIVCCICSASIEANSQGICEACQRKNIDISSQISKEGILYYCKNCGRYLRPPWMKCEMESNEMMQLCLSKIKGLNKAKIIESAFVWTEPHSKLIKLKITIEKEFNKNSISTSFIVTFKVEWTQCEDCRKTFTPHLWNTAVQIRQNVRGKSTLLLLEQLILKNKQNKKFLSIKEHKQGFDVYFTNRSQAASFVSFIDSQLTIKSKQSRQLIATEKRRRAT